jgi:MSHA biogenesis protein MshI
MSQQINLLNAALLTPDEKLSASVVALAAWVTAILMMVAYGWTSYRISQLVDEQQVVTQELASLKQQLHIATLRDQQRAPSQALLEQVTIAEASLKEHQQVQIFLQGGYLDNKQGFSEYMATFARQSMRGLWLTHFSIDDSLGNIKISGRALSRDLVPTYIAGLGQAPVLHGHDFDTLEMNTVDQPSLAANAMPGSSNLGAASIIEFKLQSRQKKPVMTANQRAVRERKH